MEKKKDIKFILAFIAIVVISFAYLFQASYAKYKKEITGSSETQIASWNIKVNNEIINNETTLTNDIVPVLDTNQFVKEGVIAPGSTGYFDLVINALDVDVDFTYEISGTVSEDTPLSDLILTEYEINGVRTTYNPTNKITGTLVKNTGDTSIRVYFKWNDDSTETMNNQQDTAYAIDPDHQPTEIEVHLKFLQKKA